MNCYWCQEKMNRYLMNRYLTAYICVKCPPNNLMWRHSCTYEIGDEYERYTVVFTDLKIGIDTQREGKETYSSITNLETLEEIARVNVWIDLFNIPPEELKSKIRKVVVFG